MVRFYIAIFSIIFLFFSCAKSEGFAFQIQATDERKQQEEKLEKLKEKAKEAFEFCEKNKFNTEFCILVDMKIHSGKNRMFVWDFKKDTIVREALCAHGIGKGDNLSTEEKPAFSNKEGSYCTSLGKYKLGIRSYSQWGINVHYKMHGLEKTNDNAYKRIVVLHSHNPVPDEEIAPKHLPMGWSLGCPVTSNEMMTYLDKRLQMQKKSTLLWIFY